MQRSKQKSWNQNTWPSGVVEDKLQGMQETEKGPVWAVPLISHSILLASIPSASQLILCLQLPFIYFYSIWR